MGSCVDRCLVKQWMDGYVIRIFYAIPVRRFISSFQSHCISILKYEILYFDDECNRASYFMMCAFLLPKNDTNLYLPPNFTPDNSTWLDTTVVCPKGHRTLKYLQCLESSDCFDERDTQCQERSDCVQDKMGGEGCKGLDRRFECSIGTNKIPFSMVSQFSVIYFSTLK